MFMKLVSGLKVSSNQLMKRYSRYYNNTKPQTKVDMNDLYCGVELLSVDDKATILGIFL